LIYRFIELKNSILIFFIQQLPIALDSISSHILLKARNL
jgi:hypothetical protein